MANELTELKPCPFCGGRPVYYIDHTVEECNAVYCESCDVTVSDFGFDKPTGYCREFWNTRAAPKVKPLVWEFWSKSGEHPHGIADRGAVSQTTILGTYRINSYRGVVESSVFLGADLIFKGDYTDCKPAAQSDYERRILVALE